VLRNERACRPVQESLVTGLAPFFLLQRPDGTVLNISALGFLSLDRSFSSGLRYCPINLSSSGLLFLIFYSRIKAREFGSFGTTDSLEVP
jgi:hypothetical protein